MICASTSRSQLLIFPFLPFMVHDFFPHLDKHELGYYAGIHECIIDQSGSPKAHINVLAWLWSLGAVHMQSDSIGWASLLFR